jgi:uncharacterized protein YndB with AHSA1/START domain
MNDVHATIDIAAPPSAVWRVAMDPERLGDWVSIHRKLHKADPWPPREGARMDQTLALRGAPFKVKWTLARCEDERLAEWQGKGPAHSRAQTEYRLSPTPDGGTRFEYRNSFRAPLGPLGAVASRVVVGDLPTQEAQASLAALKTLCEAEQR